MMPKGKHDTRRIDNLLASVTDDLLGHDLADQLAEEHLRVERILLELTRPDPIQPRRVLPERIHRAFHSNQMTPTQALRELVQVAQVAARQRGQPFNAVLELLPNPESEGDDSDARLSPEEELLRDLVTLAVTIRDDGQVNPVTVVDVTQGVTRQYRIETGERRYWAAWLLRDFISGYENDGMLDCIVVPADRSSVFRQAKENTARRGLTAIAMARQAALLLLTVHGYDIPSEAVPNDFYRQALELTLRGKREYTESILTAMGGIDRRRFSQHKSLLQLSDEALELADRHNIDEFRLRPVLSLPKQYHAEMVKQIIDLNLTGRQVQQICEQGMVETAVQKEQGPSPQAKRFVKFIKAAKHGSMDEYAAALLAEEKHPDVAVARIKSAIELLEALRKRIEGRR